MIVVKRLHRYKAGMRISGSDFLISLQYYNFKLANVWRAQLATLETR